MSETPTVIEIDCSTGISTERSMTADEIANMQAVRAEAEARRQAEEAEAARVADLKASAKQKLITGQPLTEDEASVLVI